MKDKVSDLGASLVYSHAMHDGPKTLCEFPGWYRAYKLDPKGRIALRLHLEIGFAISIASLRREFGSMGSRSEVVQVVDENGVFNDQLEAFVQSSEVGLSGPDYQVIAVTGPQSSGKSTLMNVLVRDAFNKFAAA